MSPPEIRPGQSVELLKALHLLTRDGKLNQDSRRKLKQVYHLYHFIEPLLQDAYAASANAADATAPVLVDHGAGKSYLGFILYDLFLKTRPRGQVIGVESRAELVHSSRQLAARLDFPRMQFFAHSVEEAIASPAIPPRVDIVTALHACDTATDDAIRFALARDAQSIVLVPCCQAEVASALRARKAEALATTPLAELWRHPLHTREFASHLTNVLRCLLLQAHGYQLTVTELVGWEHSMKNELIIARKTDAHRGDARARAESILTALQLDSLRPRFLS
ncbi:SAM-dependent methyltransferase [Betaproteobacteria bacterium]|nr:SAM-dependent methyltransferase [Betaproteobacteria bacterium]